MKVGEEEGPERVLVDPVRRDDARRGPEVVPVERLVRLPPRDGLAHARRGRREHREKRRDRAGPQAPSERRAGREDAAGREARGPRDAEVEEQAGVDPEHLADRRERVVPEVRVGERRAREPGLGRGERRRPQERVEEREVHRLFARVDLRAQGAEDEEEEKRAPGDELGLPALGDRRPEGLPAREQEAAGDERGGPGDEEGPPERRPAPRHEEPRSEGEEQDTARLPERVEARALGQDGREERVAREAEELEEPGVQKQRGGREPQGRKARRRAPGGGRPRAGGGDGGLGEEEFVPRERAGRRSREEPGLDLAGRQLFAVLEDEDLRVVVDAERLVRELVRKLEAEERRARRERLREREPEISREEETERAVRERELVRRARHGAVETLRLEDDAVRGGELPREVRHLRGRVRLVEPEHDRRVTLGRPAGEREREALVPVLLEDAGLVGHVLVEPLRGRDGAVGAGVDREERERPDRGAGRDGGAQDAPGPAGGGPLRQPRARPEREDRIDRQEVPGKLHLERARDEDVRHEEGGEYPVARRKAPEGREPRSRRPQRREPQERAERPQDQLLAFVEEVRDADVLVRVRQEARAADHRALLGDRAPELAEVEERVGLAEREPGECGGAAQDRERGAAPPPSGVADGEEGREREGKEERSGARLRGERETRGRAREERVARAPAVREPDVADEREEDHEGERDVGRGVVRGLDVQHGEREEESSEEAGGLPVPPPPEERDENARERAPERGEEPPDVDDAVVGPEPRPLRDGRERGRRRARHVERERAVREEMRVQLERPEREVRDRLSDRALVRVEKVVLVEVQPHDADGGCEDEDEREPASKAQGGSSCRHGVSRRLSARGRAGESLCYLESP